MIFPVYYIINPTWFYYKLPNMRKKNPGLVLSWVKGCQPCHHLKRSRFNDKKKTIQRGLCTRESISSLAPSCGESKLFFCFEYRLMSFKGEPRKEKLTSPFIFWRKFFFLHFNRVDIHEFYLKKFLDINSSYTSH